MGGTRPWPKATRLNTCRGDFIVPVGGVLSDTDGQGVFSRQMCRAGVDRLYLCLLVFHALYRICCSVRAPLSWHLATWRAKEAVCVSLSLLVPHLLPSSVGQEQPPRSAAQPQRVLRDAEWVDRAHPRVPDDSGRVPCSLHRPVFWQKKKKGNSCAKYLCTLFCPANSAPHHRGLVLACGVAERVSP